MSSHSDNMSETAQMAMEWSTTPRQGETGVFDDDKEIIERVRSITAAVIDCDLTDRDDILKGLLMVMGYVAPVVHCPLLLSLSAEAPERVNKAFMALRTGTDAEKYAYYSLVETVGRFSRHGLFIDVMSDEEAIEDVKNIMRTRSGEQK